MAAAKPAGWSTGTLACGWNHRALELRQAAAQFIQVVKARPMTASGRLASFPKHRLAVCRRNQKSSYLIAIGLMMA